MGSRSFRLTCLTLLLVVSTVAILGGCVVVFPSLAVKSGVLLAQSEAVADNIEYKASLLRFRSLHITLAAAAIAALLAIVIRRRARFSRAGAAGLLALLPVAAVAIFFAAGLLVLFGAAIEYPFQWDYGEGNVLDEVVSIQNRLPIYTPFDVPPFTVVNYPPVFMAACAAFDWVVPLPPLGSGRLLSALCTLLAAIGIAGLASTVIREHVSSSPYRVCGGVAGVLFLGVYPVFEWAPLMRVDLMAAMFTMFGLLAFVSAERQPNRLYVATAMFLMAGFTRQSALAAPAACFVVALARQPRAALRFAAMLGIPAALGFVLINILSGGDFYDHIIWANSAHKFTWSRSVVWTRELVLTYPLFLAVAAVSVVVILRRFGIGGEG